MKKYSFLFLLIFSPFFVLQQSKAHTVLLDMPQFESTPYQAENNVSKALAKANKKLAQMARPPHHKLNFSNTIQKLENIYYSVDCVGNRMNLLAVTSLNEELRKKAKEMGIKINNWHIDTSSRKDIYQVIQSYAKTNPSLEEEDKKLFEKTMTEYKRMGFNLPEAKQATIKSIKKEIVELEETISNNITASNNNELKLTSSEVEGINESLLKNLKRDEEANYIIRAGVRHEINTITENSPSENVRKKVYAHSLSRANKDNISLIKKVIALRSKLAKLLGYKNWSDYKLENLMAQNGKKATHFINDLISKIDLKFRSEIKELQKIKRKETQDTNSQINSWDVGYFTKKYQAEKFQLDTSDLKKYFKYENVLQGMFRIFEKVFQINIKELTSLPDEYKWTNDVRAVLISDSKSKTPLGLLYLDMFPRPEHGKYGHFAMFTIRSAKVFSSGISRRPVAALVCNFPPATESDPSLLTINHVKTLFHEFGHGLHGLLTQTKFATFAGTRVVRDFVEAPSQLLESWVYDKQILDTFAQNYQNPEDKIPQHTIEKIKLAKNATIGLFYRRQLSFGLMDLRLHQEIDEQTQYDLVKYTNNILKEVYLESPENTSFITSFGHLFGGYDSAYYGYAWADNLAADMASMFEDSPQKFLNQQLGSKLRKEIYETGSSREENKSIETFLGRKTNSEAFLKKLGL